MPGARFIKPLTSVWNLRPQNIDALQNAGVMALLRSNPELFSRRKMEVTMPKFSTTSWLFLDETLDFTQVVCYFFGGVVLCWQHVFLIHLIFPIFFNPKFPSWPSWYKLINGRPLLLDNVASIQQSAALALGRLANFNETLAESVGISVEGRRNEAQ